MCITIEDTNITCTFSRKIALPQRVNMGNCDRLKLTEKACDSWNVKFDIEIGSDWTQMGPIWDFLRSVSVHFGAVPNYL